MRLVYSDSVHYAGVQRGVHHAVVAVGVDYPDDAVFALHRVVYFAFGFGVVFRVARQFDSLPRGYGGYVVYALGAAAVFGFRHENQVHRHIVAFRVRRVENPPRHVRRPRPLVLVGAVADYRHEVYVGFPRPVGAGARAE